MVASFTPSSFSNAASSSNPAASSDSTVFQVRDYDLTTTLTSGQAFRWTFRRGAWVGIVGRRWVQLRADSGAIAARTAEPAGEWNWLANYLQVDQDLSLVLNTFPNDPPMQAAMRACRGLRLLRQDAWECLASFILSSTKRITQIQQIVATLCERFGEPLTVPGGERPAYGFPAPERLARGTEVQLRECKMGFRAPYLLAAARQVAGGKLDLQALSSLPLEVARGQLMRLGGVGRKIADCVLLFACGFPSAFPVDVWVLKALRQLYFPQQRPGLKRLHHFSETHFGPFGGYAQQYLFHYMRTQFPRSNK